MKAIQYQRYGTPEVIRLTDVPTPQPASNQVLVRIHRTIVTPTDVSGRKGTPYVVRLFTGLFRPRIVPGVEFAGIVEAVGEKVRNFRPGDRVVGASTMKMGAHAEYILLPEKGLLAHLPEDLDMGQAAGFCDGGMTALNFWNNKGNLKPGQNVLVIGASGSVGTAAVQIARQMGAKVTGVCSTKNVDLVRSLGAEQVLDYTRQPLHELTDTYDLILDAVAKSSMEECCALLKPEGRYLTTVPTFRLMFQMLWTRFFSKKKAVFYASSFDWTAEDLTELMNQLASGELRSVVDRSYSLEDMEEAHRYVEAGHKVGSVVVEVTPAESRSGKAAYAAFLSR